MAVRAGRMIRVVLERPSTSRDAASNEPVATWATVTKTWATKRLLTAKERFQGSQHASTVDAEWIFRYRTPFDPRWRIKEDRTGEYHEIVGVHDRDGKRRELLVRTTSFRPDANAELVP